MTLDTHGKKESARQMTEGLENKLQGGFHELEIENSVKKNQRVWKSLYKFSGFYVHCFRFLCKKTFQQQGITLGLALELPPGMKMLILEA